MCVGCKLYLATTMTNPEDILLSLDVQENIDTLVEAMPIPVLVTSRASGTIMLANEVLWDLFGVSAEDLEGRAAPDFYVDPADQEDIVRTLEEEGWLSSREVRGERATGPSSG